jgi:hypothetical protein
MLKTLIPDPAGFREDLIKLAVLGVMLFFVYQIAHTSFVKSSEIYSHEDAYVSPHGLSNRQVPAALLPGEHGGAGSLPRGSGSHQVG